MGHELIKHTGDIRLHVWGSNLNTIFTEGVVGLMHVLKPNVQLAPSQKKSSHLIKIESPDLTALFIDFLGEVLALSYAHKEIYAEVKILELSQTKLVAQIHGVRIHAFEADVKAVTYHEAKLVKNSRGDFDLTCVLDI